MDQGAQAVTETVEQRARRRAEEREAQQAPLSAILPLKSEMRRRLYDHQGGNCALCGEKMDVGRRQTRRSATFEHIRPVSQGGRFEMRNLLLTHAGCNTRRGNRQAAFRFDPIE